MLNSFSLLAALESFLRQRQVDVEKLSVDPMVRLMVDWFRLAPIDLVKDARTTDVLVYRHGGWSEGCATGFRFSLLRRITEQAAAGGDTDWTAGVTLMFDPGRYAELASFETVSSDWPSVEAFLHAVESSSAYKTLVAQTPMSVMLESGGLR